MQDVAAIRELNHPQLSDWSGVHPKWSQIIERGWKDSGGSILHRSQKPEQQILYVFRDFIPKCAGSCLCPKRGCFGRRRYLYPWTKQKAALLETRLDRRLYRRKRSRNSRNLRFGAYRHPNLNHSVMGACGAGLAPKTIAHQIFPSAS